MTSPRTKTPQGREAASGLGGKMMRALSDARPRGRSRRARRSCSTSKKTISYCLSVLKITSQV